MSEPKDINISLQGLLFPNIFKLFKVAIQPGRVMTAFLAMAVIFGAGWLMDLHKTVVVSNRVSMSDLRRSTLSGPTSIPTELHCFISHPDRLDSYIKVYQDRVGTQKFGVFNVFSNFCAANFNEGVIYLLQLRFDMVVAAIGNCISACVWILEYHTIYGIIFLLISFVVLSIAGGAISRGAALYFSKDERADMSQCARFAIKNIMPILFAPTAPLMLVALLGFVIVYVLGLITNIPYAGELIMAIGFIIVLVAGAIMAFTTIWAAASVNLMYGAIAYECSDTFDAICRAYNYVYSKPWRLVAYSLLAAFYGGICYLFVRLCGFVMLSISRWFLDIGVFTQGRETQQFGKLDIIWSKPEYFNFMGDTTTVAKSVTESIASGIVYFEILMVSGLVAAFVISLYFSAGTMIYCLLRNKVDNTPIDNVFVEKVEATEMPVSSEAQ